MTSSLRKSNRPDPAFCVPLSTVQAGRSVVLRRVSAGWGMTARLAAMGLVPGTALRVHRNDRCGPVVVEIHGSRVVLGRGMARSVAVEEERPGD
jgi:ferrous iron transport protein A